MKTFDGADAVVRHCVTVHPDKYVSLLWPLLNANGQLIKYKLRLLNIKGCQIEGDTDNIRIFDNKLHIPARTVRQSPVHKCARVITPTKDVHKKLFVNTDEAEGQDKNEILDKLEYIDEGIGPVSLFSESEPRQNLDLSQISFDNPIGYILSILMCMQNFITIFFTVLEIGPFSLFSEFGAQQSLNQ